MKLPQFTINTLLQVTAATAIALGSYLGYLHYVLRPAHPLVLVDDVYPLYMFGITIPLWLPVVFAAIAVARKSLTMAMVAAFAVAAAAGVGVAQWCAQHPLFFISR